ncbi:MAG: hypothetical protein IH959_10725 [Chloroflexi bacterium]|nr:hypothetical protein [Chloroflexota bacterium]
MSPLDWHDVGAITAGTHLLSVLTTFRDIVIVTAGALMILVLLALFIFTVVVGMATRTLLKTVGALVNDEVMPLVQSARHTTQRVRGTISFISETSVTPFIRVFSIVAGARRMVGVLSGITGRRNRANESDDEPS